MKCTIDIESFQTKTAWWYAWRVVMVIARNHEFICKVHGESWLAEGEAGPELVEGEGNAYGRPVSRAQ